MPKIVCKSCDSENVEIKAWVNPNTNDCAQVHYIEELPIEETWCEDCQDHCGVKFTADDEEEKLIKWIRGEQ